jgi:hypothetical protein
MDADMVCHTPITHEFIQRMAGPAIGLGFLGREKKFTECGLYSMNLRNAATQEFLIEFQKAVEDYPCFVAHNAEFDFSIIKNNAEKLDIKLNLHEYFCTMKSSTNYCMIKSDHPYSPYKWPKLSELAEKLGKVSGKEDYQLFLCNSGAEANENALKLASFHTGRKKIVAFTSSAQNNSIMHV